MNPKVATIVPANHLDLIKDDDYFMALAHVAKARPDYVEFFKARSDEGKCVILDNSAVEEGGPGSFEAYMDIAVSIGAKVIMLPDYFKDAKATVEAARKSMDYVDYWIDLQIPNAEIMIIPQGETIPEWLDCALELQDIVISYGFKPFVGISCRYTEMLGGSRSSMALTVYSAISHYLGKVHFLGCYADPRKDVMPVMEFPWVSGVDSSYAAVYAQHRYFLTEDSFNWPRPPRNIDFIDDRYDPKLLAMNIEVWRKACRNGAG